MRFSKAYIKTLKETPRTKTEKLVTIDKEQGENE